MADKFKKRNDNLVSDTLKIIDDMFCSDEKVNFYTVPDKAEVSRSFLYNHVELREKIETYRDFPYDNKEYIITYEELKNRNKDLIARVEQYNNQVFEMLKSSNMKRN